MSGKSTLKNFKNMLAEAKLPEKTVEVCLRGDLAADFEAAERALSDAEANRGNSLDSGTEVAELADRIEALRAQMLDSTYPFRVRALPKRKFRALVSDHPPRPAGEDMIHEDDRGFGVNITTFFDALIRQCVVDPELADEEWSELLDEKLTDNQFDTLAVACWYVNRSDVDVPFSYAASRIKKSSASD